MPQWLRLIDWKKYNRACPIKLKLVFNFQVTWCYPVEGNQQYCATGFPMGCYVDKNANPQDACVISKDYSKSDTY